MGLLLGDIAPDFTAETSDGPISFHEWIGENWVVFFSHPADYTPVCTTELGFTAKLKDQLAERNTKAIALSVDSVRGPQGLDQGYRRDPGRDDEFPDHRRP